MLEARLWRADAGEAGSLFRCGGVPLLWLPASGSGTGCGRLLFPWERSGNCHLHCIVVDIGFPPMCPDAGDLSWKVVYI